MTFFWFWFWFWTHPPTMFSFCNIFGFHRHHREVVAGSFPTKDFDSRFNLRSKEQQPTGETIFSVCALFPWSRDVLTRVLLVVVDTSSNLQHVQIHCADLLSLNGCQHRDVPLNYWCLSHWASADKVGYRLNTDTAWAVNNYNNNNNTWVNSSSSVIYTFPYVVQKPVLI